MNTTEMAKALGRRGGLSRAKRLPAEERKRIASLGGEARRRSREAMREIAINSMYAAMMTELQGGPVKVTRVKNFTGRLPGIYRSEGRHG